MSITKQLTKYLVITLIIALGFGQLLRFDFYGLPLYLHDGLVLCILALLILQGEAPQATRSLGFMGVALLLSSIRALTLYPLHALLVPALYLIRLLSYLALYTTLKNSKLIIPRVYYLISGFTTLVIGLAQYFFMPDMRVFHFLGWDDHLSRLILPHFDPTFSAVMLALSLLSFTGIWRLSSIIYLPAILLTYSRSVWVSLVFTATCFIQNKKVLLFAVCCMLFAITILPHTFGEGTNLLRTFSIQSRISSDLSYLRTYKWDLLTGRGLNTLVLEQGTTHATGPNNSYLYLLVTTGVLGLLGWGIFLRSIYISSLHKPMLIFFFIASLFNNVVFYPFALLWVLLVESSIDT